MLGTLRHLILGRNIQWLLQWPKLPILRVTWLWWRGSASDVWEFGQFLLAQGLAMNMELVGVPGARKGVEIDARTVSNSVDTCSLILEVTEDT